MFYTGAVFMYSHNIIHIRVNKNGELYHFTGWPRFYNIEMIFHMYNGEYQQHTTDS